MRAQVGHEIPCRRTRGHDNELGAVRGAVGGPHARGLVVLVDELGDASGLAQEKPHAERGAGFVDGLEGVARVRVAVVPVKVPLPARQGAVLVLPDLAQDILAAVYGGETLADLGVPLRRGPEGLQRVEGFLWGALGYAVEESDLPVVRREDAAWFPPGFQCFLRQGKLVYQ